MRTTAIHHNRTTILPIRCLTANRLNNNQMMLALLRLTPTLMIWALAPTQTAIKEEEVEAEDMATTDRMEITRMATTTPMVEEVAVTTTTATAVATIMGVAHVCLC